MQPWTVEIYDQAMDTGKYVRGLCPDPKTGNPKRTEWRCIVEYEKVGWIYIQQTSPQAPYLHDYMSGRIPIGDAVKMRLAPRTRDNEAWKKLAPKEYAPPHKITREELP